MHKTYCDKCDREITEDSDLGSLSLRRPVDLDASMKLFRNHPIYVHYNREYGNIEFAHLCRNCSGKFFIAVMKVFGNEKENDEEHES